MDLANALFGWNDWVVFPAFTVAALVLHLRRRRSSTLLLFVGLAVLLAGRAMLTTFSQTPLHPWYVTGLVMSTVGFVAALAGAVWFWRKDFHVSSNRA
jgi:hypothetical protein